ncbi:homeobox protein cut-like 2 [Polymixia lowei]
MAADVGSMFQYWKKFDLRRLQRELNSVASELAGRQEESEHSHKHLVELSREFKRNVPEEVREMVAPVLKSFQAQVVALNKRSKEAESAFLGIYKQLIEAPDPAPVLEATHTLEGRLRQLQSSAPDSETLVREISGHWKKHLECLDKTEEGAAVSGTVATVSGEAPASSLPASRMTPNSTQAPRALGSPQQNHQDRAEGEEDNAEVSLADRLSEADERIKVLHSSLNTAQTELLDLRCKYSQEMTNKAEEVGAIMTNLEKANQRAEMAQREVERLKEQLASARNATPRSCHPVEGTSGERDEKGEALPSQLEAALLAKDREILRLLENVQRLQFTLQEVQETSANQILELERQLAYKTEAIEVSGSDTFKVTAVANTFNIGHYAWEQPVWYLGHGGDHGRTGEAQAELQEEGEEVRQTPVNRWSELPGDSSPRSATLSFLPARVPRAGSRRSEAPPLAGSLPVFGLTKARWLPVLSFTAARSGETR